MNALAEFVLFVSLGCAAIGAFAFVMERNDR